MIHLYCGTMHTGQPMPKFAKKGKIKKEKFQKVSRLDLVFSWHWSVQKNWNNSKSGKKWQLKFGIQVEDASLHQFPCTKMQHFEAQMCTIQVLQ